jgi:hypothetical protein
MKCDDWWQSAGLGNEGLDKKVEAVGGGAGCSYPCGPNRLVVLEAPPLEVAQEDWCLGRNAPLAGQRLR